MGTGCGRPWSKRTSALKVAHLFDRIRRARNGTYRVKLPDEERALLRTLPAQLRELLQSDDAALERLFPPAYPDDTKRNEEYNRLMRGDLVSARMSSVDVMEQTIDQEVLDEDQLVAWLGALNDLRLILGTRLDVSEDMYGDEMPDDDPRAPAFALYSYLGWLQEQVVEALAVGLP